MNVQPPKRRKVTQVSLDEALVADAEALGVDITRACEAGLSAEVREAKRRRWVEENRDAIQSWNDWVAKNELPLAKYRQF